MEIKKIQNILQTYSEIEIKLSNVNTNNFDQSLNRLDIRLKHSTSTGSYYTIGFGYDNEKLERTNISVKPEHKSQILY